MLRLVALGLLLGVSLMAPLGFFLLCAIAYMAYFGPVAPIVIAVLIDAQFGEPTRTFPYIYTVLTVTVTLIVRFVRPLLRV